MPALSADVTMCFSCMKKLTRDKCCCEKSTLSYQIVSELVEADVAVCHVCCN